MYVDPGELNKRIQIVQRLSGENYDSEGLPIKRDIVVRTCWAKVTNTSGKELVAAGSEFAEARKRFLVRFTSTPITTAMVVRYRAVPPSGPVLDERLKDVQDAAGEDITAEADQCMDDHDIVYINPYGDSREYLEIWTKLSKREV